MRRIKSLEEKKIVKAYYKKIEEKHENYDDVPFLFLEMEDGSIFKITSLYGTYTGESKDEYPCFIDVEKIKKRSVKK